MDQVLTFLVCLLWTSLLGITTTIACRRSTTSWNEHHQNLRMRHGHDKGSFCIHGSRWYQLMRGFNPVGQQKEKTAIQTPFSLTGISHQILGGSIHAFAALGLDFPSKMQPAFKRLSPRRYTIICRLKVWSRYYLARRTFADLRDLGPGGGCVPVVRSSQCFFIWIGMLFIGINWVQFFCFVHLCKIWLIHIHTYARMHAPFRRDFPPTSLVQPWSPPFWGYMK